MRKPGPALLFLALASLAGCNKAPDASVAAATAPVNDGYRHFAAGGSVNCDARPLSLDGSHTRVEVIGVCGRIRVTGEHNDVIVGMAPGGSIEVTGEHNDIWWHATGRGRLPDLRAIGASNSFHREDS